MHPFLGSYSFLTTDQLYTSLALAGMDSSEKATARHDSSAESEVKEVASALEESDTQTTVLLAMRPTCARNDYQASLIAQGFKTIAVDDAEQGLRVLRELVPSLVVVEPELEGGSGDRLLDTIQREMQFDQIPVFVVSGAANRSAIFRVAKFKIDDFAVLPISAGAFTIRVLKLLNGRKT